MKNKVLIKLEVPSLNETFDLFLPVNEILWKINKMLVKCVSDLSNGCFDTTKEYFLANKTTGKIYENNDIVIHTDIRNGTELVLFY